MQIAQAVANSLQHKWGLLYAKLCLNMHGYGAINLSPPLTHLHCSVWTLLHTPLMFSSMTKKHYEVRQGVPFFLMLIIWLTPSKQDQAISTTGVVHGSQQAMHQIIQGTTGDPSSWQTWQRRDAW